jgi:hypothetical protein
MLTDPDKICPGQVLRIGAELKFGSLDHGKISAGVFGRPAGLTKGRLLRVQSVERVQGAHREFGVGVVDQHRELDL